MVKLFILLFLFTSTVLAEENKYSPENLKKAFTKKGKDNRSAADRLKATNIKTDELRLLRNGKGLSFKLPNGKWVKGLLLDNNRVAPLFYESGVDYPACVKKDMTLIKGRWNKKESVIECDLKQQDLAIIDNQQSTKAIVLTQEKIKAKAEEERNKITRAQEKISAQKEKRKPTALTVKKYNTDGSLVTLNVTGNVTGNVKEAINEQGDVVEVKRTRKPVRLSNQYTPPSRSSSRAKTTSAVLNTEQKKYGISIGTWAKCRLKRNVSSTEAGFIEFVLEGNLEGKYKTIPKGTTLFANKSLNKADKRLEATIVKALTPDKEEIDVILANVYSLDKTAGLKGKIDRDIGLESEQAGSNALLTGLSSIVGSGATVLGSVVSDYSQEMIDNQDKFSREKITAKIQVSQQPCLIQVSKTF
jgi:hypothetical protein